MDYASFVDTQKTHAAAQLARNSAVEIAESPTPWREASLEAFRRRNAALDAFFYDVGKITPAETATIAPWLASEGALLIVPPSSDQPVRLCTNVDAFAMSGGGDLRVLTVSGVGSSALGSAAFARNVADAVGEPVAALVSGYGMSDLLTEAAGGWFWFGALNHLRHQFEILDDRFHIARDDIARAGLQASVTRFNRASTSLDTRVLVSVLSDPRFGFKLLSGHSKGNLVISEALYNLGASKSLDWYHDKTVVTVSATISMPVHLKKVINVIGEWDWLGGLNSRPWLQSERKLLRAWHHTNTALPWSVDVTGVFQELIDSGDLAVE